MIITIINFITSFSILLGGFTMKKYAVSPPDYSIGFKSEKSMASKEAWSFANQNCGKIWIAVGAAGLILTIVSVFTFGSILKLAVLILQIIAVIASAVYIEDQLEKKFGSK